MNCIQKLFLLLTTEIRKYAIMKRSTQELKNQLYLGYMHSFEVTFWKLTANIFKYETLYNRSFMYLWVRYKPIDRVDIFSAVYTHMKTAFTYSCSPGIQCKCFKYWNTHTGWPRYVPGRFEWGSVGCQRAEIAYISTYKSRIDSRSFIENSVCKSMEWYCCIVQIAMSVIHRCPCARHHRLAR